MSDLQEVIASSSIRAFNSGYANGYQNGTLDTSEELRKKLIKNVIADAVISTCADVRILERVVEIIEET